MLSTARDQAAFNQREQQSGNAFLGAFPACNDFAGSVNDFDGVVGRADCLRVVEHHQVAALFFELHERPEPLVVGLQGEAYEPLPGPLRRAERGHYVGSLNQLQDQRLAVFGQLVLRDAPRPVVARSGGPDDAVASRKQTLASRKEILGRYDGVDFRSRWIFS